MTGSRSDQPAVCIKYTTTCRQWDMRPGQLARGSPPAKVRAIKPLGVFSMTYRVALATALALALAACGPQPAPAPTTAASAKSEPVASEPPGAVLTTSPEIKGEDFAARVKELADDKYEGRGPGTVAGE